MDVIEYNTLLSYDDDIVIIGESKSEIITSILKLLK